MSSFPMNVAFIRIPVAITSFASTRSLVSYPEHVIIMSPLQHFQLWESHAHRCGRGSTVPELSAICADDVLLWHLLMVNQTFAERHAHIKCDTSIGVGSTSAVIQIPKLATAKEKQLEGFTRLPFTQDVEFSIKLRWFAQHFPNFEVQGTFTAALSQSSCP